MAFALTNIFSRTASNLANKTSSTISSQFNSAVASVVTQKNISNVKLIKKTDDFKVFSIVTKDLRTYEKYKPLLYMFATASGVLSVLAFVNMIRSASNTEFFMSFFMFVPLLAYFVVASSLKHRTVENRFSASKNTVELCVNRSDEYFLKTKSFIIDELDIQSVPVYNERQKINGYKVIISDDKNTYDWISGIETEAQLKSVIKVVKYIKAQK